MGEVVPGKTAWGVGQWEEGEKEATAGCVPKQTTSVGSRGSAPPGTSGDGVEYALSFLPEPWGNWGI